MGLNGREVRLKHTDNYIDIYPQNEHDSIADSTSKQLRHANERFSNHLRRTPIQVIEKDDKGSTIRRTERLNQRVNITLRLISRAARWPKPVEKTKGPGDTLERVIERRHEREPSHESGHSRP
jgi:hypothetical protein